MFYLTLSYSGGSRCIPQDPQGHLECQRKVILFPYLSLSKSVFVLISCMNFIYMVVFSTVARNVVKWKPW